MKGKIILLLLLSFSISMFGQSTFDSAADSDPRAKKILDKLKNEYDSYKTMEVSFDLVMELPGQDKETQRGSVIQDGDKFKLELEDRAVYNNGEIVSLHIKKNNEVQYNDADMDEDEGMLSPKDMLSVYDKEEVAFAITDEPLVGGVKTVKIDFKPLDDDSEYSKMSLFVQKSNNKMKEMKVFSKDGSRYTLKILDITPNKTYGPETFTFDASKWPGIHEEDLRID